MRERTDCRYPCRCILTTEYQEMKYRRRVWSRSKLFLNYMGKRRKILYIGKFTLAGGAMNKKIFGMTTNGEAVYKYSIENSKGMKVVIMDFGATIVDLWVPDKDGSFRDVCPGYDDVASYEKETTYFGVSESPIVCKCC